MAVFVADAQSNVTTPYDLHIVHGDSFQSDKNVCVQVSCLRAYQNI